MGQEEPSWGKEMYCMRLHECVSNCILKTSIAYSKKEKRNANDILVISKDFRLWATGEQGKSNEMVCWG